MQRIKVAFFAETLIENHDGAVRTMYHLINRIPKSNFEFLFVCGAPPTQSFPHKVWTMPSLTIPFNANYKMVLPFLSPYKTTNYLDEFQPNIIHIATPSPMGHFALKYGKIKGLPIISIYHTHFLSYVDYYLKNTPFLIQATKNKIAEKSKSFYDNCDLVYVPTQEMIDYLADYQHHTDRMKIWQRGVNKNIFSPTKCDKNKIKNLVKNDKPNILFTSRLVWEKNLDTLIAFEQLNQAEGAPYNLLIAGDGIAKKELEEKMPNAFFLGNIAHDELAVYYASSDVFLFPSISETYGNVVIEAMAAGLPCVIANGGGSKSFIEPGINGILCQPNNPRDYFNKIQLVLNQPQLYALYVKNGLAYTKSLDWEQLAATYFEDLQLLVNRQLAEAA